MKWPRRTRPPVPGQGSAWTGFVAGVAASIAANVLHAMEGTWSYPELVGAAFWPTALLISVEILTRIAWPRGWQWIIARCAGVIVVAIVAAALSYLHMRSLLLTWGEGKFQATIGPLAVDGLMLISATALLAISRHRAPVPMLAGVNAADPELSAKIRAAVLEQQVPLGVDAAGKQIATAVLAHLPAPPPGLGKSSSIRIPLGGGSRRTRPRGRVAGRRRLTAAPPLEAAPAHPAPPPPPPVQPPVEVAALNDNQRRDTTSAPLNGKPKATGAKKPRGGKRQAGALDQASYDKAFQFWQTETARGNAPSAQQVADVIGRSRATGGRLLQEFKTAVPVTT